MSDAPKAIETHYNGYRFRSRLEARWAVVLDELAVPYEYEPEGYVVPGGVSYLPDFFVRPWDAFLEVKRGVQDEPDAEERQWGMEAIAKAQGLAHATGKLVLLSFGAPLAADQGTIACHGNGAWGVAEWGSCVRCGVLCVRGQTYWQGQRALPVSVPFTRCAHDEGVDTSDQDGYLRRAFLAGRRARFEFGERGR